jgi:hypothetical protein
MRKISPERRARRDRDNARGRVLWLKLFNDGYDRAGFGPWKFANELLAFLERNHPKEFPQGTSADNFKDTIKSWLTTYPATSMQVWVDRVHRFLVHRDAVAQSLDAEWDELLRLPNNPDFTGRAPSQSRRQKVEPAAEPVPATLDGPQTDSDLTPYLTLLSRRLDFVEPLGDWSQAGLAPTLWRLTDLYWRAPVTLRTSRSLSPSEAPVAEDGARPGSQTIVRAAAARVEPGPAEQEGTASCFGPALLHRQVSVVGAQGVGKGCLLRHTAIAYACAGLGDQARWKAMRAINQLPDQPMLPVFIDVRDAQLDGRDCIDWSLLVREAVMQLGPDGADSREGIVEALLDRIRKEADILLIIDGLDEAPSAAVVRQIDDLAKALQHDHPTVTLVRSARWTRGRLALVSEAQIEVQLDPLPLQDRPAFLRRLLTHAQAPDPEGWAERALDMIDALPDAPRMSRTPLFLVLFAASLPDMEDWKGASGRLLEALLRAMFHRNRGARRITDLAGWPAPAAHVALWMSSNNSQQIRETDLHVQLARAFEHLRMFPVCVEVKPLEYAQAMINSGLLRERRRGATPFGDAAYDFALEELQSWLAIKALKESWTPDRPNLSQESDWTAALDFLLGTGDFRIPGDKRGLLRQGLTEAPVGIARAYLDHIVDAADAPENLTFALAMMAQGLAPDSRASWRLVQKVLDLTEPPTDPAMPNALARLRREFTEPHQAPRAWGRLLGLHADGLAGADTSLLTDLSGFTWLTDPDLVALTRQRLDGDDIGEACATAYEVLYWAFANDKRELTENEAAGLAEIARALGALAAVSDVRADFSLWALSWLAQAATLSPAWIDVSALLGSEALETALAAPTQSDPALWRAAMILSKQAPPRTDMLLDWASALEAGARIGSLTPPPPPPAPRPDSIAALRSAFSRASGETAQGRIALAMLQLGGAGSREVEAAIRFAAGSGRPFDGMVLLALSRSSASLWARQLQPFLTAETADMNLRATILLLAFADRAEIERLRRSAAARDWPADVRADIDHALARENQPPAPGLELG